MPLLLLLFVAVVAAACSDPEASGERCGEQRCSTSQRCDLLAGRCTEKLADRCRAPQAWSKGSMAFADATERWGLEGVEGTRLSVADVDGDGWPDLSARRVGADADDFSEGGRRATWLLRNVEGRHFEDVTKASGLVAARSDPARSRPTEIVVWADVDNDGDVDAFTAFSNTDPFSQPETAEILRNDGTGHFALGPAGAAIRLQGEATSIGAATFLDADRDGNVDLFVGHGAVGGTPGQDRLYRGTGSGIFVESTEEAGLSTRPWGNLDDLDAARSHGNAWGSVACDLNGDGDPELAVSSYGRAPNHLWQAQGGGRFVNRSIESGYAFDENLDWRDNESARCHCKLNPDAPECEGVPPPENIRCESQADVFRWNHANDRRPFRLGGNTATTVCADVNGDGALDLFNTEIVHWDVGSSSDPSQLLLNRGEADVRFERPGNEAMGLQRKHERLDWNEGDITAAIFDFDNDGRPDLYLGSTDYPGTRGHLFRQREDGRFEELPLTEGIDHEASLGVAVADFDGDGDLDLVAGHSHMRCEDQCYPTPNVRFFENLLGQDGNWVQLDLVGGEGTNRGAIGARVELRAGERVQTQEVGGGHGHYGMQHEHALHFGLGEACSVEAIVRWPDAELKEERFTLQSGYRYRIEQGRMPEAIRK